MVGVARGHQRADTLKPYSQKRVNLITLGPQPYLTQWNQAMPAGQPKMGQSWWRGLTECGPLEKGMQTTSVFCLENPMNSMKRRNDRILKKELPRSVGTQYATGDQWRNNSRKNEVMETKQKQYPVVDVTGNRSKVWCCKEQYCIGTWNVRSMNQGKLKVVKQEMIRVNVDILGISKLNGLKWVNLTQMTTMSTTAGRNPLEEME